MKIRIITILLFTFTIAAIASGQTIVKNNPVGKWKFDAPYAPEGYTSGTIIVGIAEEKHTATMSFTGNQYQIPAEKVKAANDSLIFTVYVEGQDVKVMLKMENGSKMSGKAVYSQGEVALDLTKFAPEEETKQ